MEGLFVGLIKWYQRVLSPKIEGGCYYEPSCSEYMILSLRKYGSIIGLIKGLRRLINCKPGCEGGIDYP